MTRLFWLSLALVALLGACAEKHPSDRLVGTWTATLSSNTSVHLTFSGDGKLTTTFKAPQTPPQTAEGAYKAIPTEDSQAFNIEGEFQGQTKTLQATLLDGGNKLSLGAPPIELTRQP